MSGPDRFFSQEPPRLGNQYREDRAFRSLMSRRFGERLRDVEPLFRDMGELAGDELYRLQLEDRLNEPVLTRWDAWGNRIDQIEVSPLWQRAATIAADMIDYAGVRARQAEQNVEGATKRLGLGVSSYFEMCGLAPSRVLGSLDYGAGGWEYASVRMLPSSNAEVITGTSPHALTTCWMSSNTRM